jgi:LysM repeat protein
VTRYAAPTVAVLAIHYGLQRPAPVSAPPTTPTVTIHRKVARTAAVTRVYIVQRGDSFSTIAAKTHTSVARLEQLNPNASPTALRVGQRIRVK